MPYPDWRAECDFENVGQIEQIGVGEAVIDRADG
jgi:hypothetical protein